MAKKTWLDQAREALTTYAPKVGNVASSFIQTLPTYSFGQKLGNVINTGLDASRNRQITNTLMEQAKLNEQAASKIRDPIRAQRLTQQAGRMYSQIPGLTQKYVSQGEQNVGQLKSSIAPTIVRTGLTLSGANRAGIFGSMFGGALGGGINYATGGNVTQGIGSGMAKGFEYSGLGKYTNPVISGVTGKLLEGVRPIVRKAASSVLLGIGNVLEDEFLSKIEGVTPQAKERLLSFGIGAAIGAFTKTPTIKDWDNLVSKLHKNKEITTQAAQQLRNKKGQWIKAATDWGDKNRVIVHGESMTWNEFLKKHNDQGGYIDLEAEITNPLKKSDIAQGRMYDINKLPENLRDMADEIQSVGAKINPDQTVTLYHRTTPEAAAEIRKTGKMFGKEDGIFFSTKPNGQAVGYGSDVVEVNVPLSKLELDDIFKDEAHLKIPTSKAGDVVKVNVAQPSIGDVKTASKIQEPATQTVENLSQTVQKRVQALRKTQSLQQGPQKMGIVGGGGTGSSLKPQGKSGVGPPGGSSVNIVSPQGKYSYNINLDRLDLTKEEKVVLDKVISQVKPELEKARGTTLSNKDVIKAAKESEILTQVTTKEQTLQAEAALLKARQNMARLDKEVSEALKSGNTQAAQGKMKELVESLRVVSSQAADKGRQLQALSIEAGEESVRQKILKDISKAEDDTARILKEAENVNWEDANSIAKFYRKFIKPSALEILDEYRYNNMLSSPRTHLKNAYSNLVQTVFTRPATLAAQGKFADAIKYYGGVVGAFPEAVKSSMKAFGGTKAIEKPDLKMLPTGKIPKVLTWPSRALEAGDVFFSSLIKGGEMARGANAADAKRIAEYSLFRGDLHPKDQGKVLGYIDNATEGIYQFGKKVPPLRWFVPFVKTPMNFAKQWIEYSPAGVLTAIGAGNKKEQYAKAFLGSMVMGVGALKAIEGNTTWAAPTDPKEKEAFYASGKKPFSVKIGDSWVSMMYAGPFAYAFALPAAMQYYNTESRTALTDTQLEKAGKITTSMAQYLSGQTFMEGLGNFVKWASGDADYSLMKNLGYTAGQLIPMDALVNYISKIVDPVYRKSEGFTQQIQSGIPGLSQSLPAYTTPEGVESRRETRNFFTPYDISKSVPRFNYMQDSRVRQLQLNAVYNRGDKIDDQMRELVKLGKKEEAVKLLKENKDVMSQYIRVKPVRKEVAKFTSYQQKVIADQRLTPEQKQKVLALIDKKIQELFNLYNQ